MQVLDIVCDGLDQILFRLSGQVACHILRSLEEDLGFSEVFQVRQVFTEQMQTNRVSSHHLVMLWELPTIRLAAF